MATFEQKQEGETFLVSDDDAPPCTLIVTHQASGRHAKVTPRSSGGFTCTLDTGTAARAGTTPAEAVAIACTRVLASHNAPKMDQACDALHQYLKEHAKGD